MGNEFITILISLLACTIALLSACYSRKSRDIAQKAINISTHQNLRPLRLAVYKLMTEYAEYCTSYRTLQHLKQVVGTNDLVERIEAFLWEIDQYGPLNMPDVESKLLEFKNKSCQLQKAIDRMAGHSKRPLDTQFETLEDNIDNIIDWFAQEYGDIKKMFAKYLEHPKQHDLRPSNTYRPCPPII